MWVCEQVRYKVIVVVYGIFEEGYGNFFVNWHGTGIAKLKN